MLNAIKKENGFTLIELTLVLIFSGFVGLTIASFFKHYTEGQRRQTTIDNLELAQNALAEYYGMEGVYPCPADPTLSGSDPNYGVAQCRNYADPGFDPNACTNLPTPNISCTTDASRDADDNGASDVVLMGVIPFKTIYDTIREVPFTNAERQDGYGRLFSYAVSETMTNSANYTTQNPAPAGLGTIRIVDENDRVLTDPPDSAHYALYSHGDNGRGGYAASGRQIDDCNVTLISGPPGPPPPGSSVGDGTIDVEFENCDYNDAVFVKGIRSVGANSNYNDDIVLFETQGFRPFWLRSRVPGHSNSIYNTNLGNVGIGEDNPQYKLHIVGDLVSETATEATDGYCDSTNTTCVDPDFLGGTGDECPDGEAAYAIGDNELKCRSVNWTIPSKSCTPNADGDDTFLRGVSNLGNIVCCTAGTNLCNIQ